ncbi:MULTISPECIES: transcriptional regulator [unclassified Roseitalea]|uniref:helix-turn-helix domain-containing transcriptional regulator n=1 Tax=unclassified Roseitalea TaxID=2639107 RepID=UPI0027401714|nr:MULTISPECIES: transcriptional regulator [unclassified Roseitalea]
MALTREFQQTVKTRAQRDPEFRLGLLREALDAFLSDDIASGKIMLRDYVNATVGFERLGRDLDKNPKSLMRMLGPDGNPRADNLFAVLSYLAAHEGAELDLRRAV